MENNMEKSWFQSTNQLYLDSNSTSRKAIGQVEA
jgi:hypothetical protein